MTVCGIGQVNRSLNEFLRNIKEIIIWITGSLLSRWKIIANFTCRMYDLWLEYLLIHLILADSLRVVVAAHTLRVAVVDIVAVSLAHSAIVFTWATSSFWYLLLMLLCHHKGCIRIYGDGQLKHVSKISESQEMCAHQDAVNLQEYWSVARASLDWGAWRCSWGDSAVRRL